jgi:hypothetical protein
MSRMDVEMLLLKALPLLPVFPSSLSLCMSPSHKFLVPVRLINNMPVNRQNKRLLWSMKNLLEEKHNIPREV